MINRRILLSFSAALLAAGCATQPAPVSVTDTVAADPQLSALAGLLRQSGLADTLNGSAAYTLFAPTNDAFKALPAKAMNELTRDPARLKDVLSYHVVPGRTTAADMKLGSVKTLQGSTLAVARAGAYMTVEEAMVQNADVMATNGVVHTIDRVLLPPKRH